MRNAGEMHDAHEELAVKGQQPGLHRRCRLRCPPLPRPHTAVCICYGKRTVRWTTATHTRGLTFVRPSGHVGSIRASQGALRLATVLAPGQRRLAPRDGRRSRSPPPHPSRWRARWWQ
eukprot:2995748-Prymnesium_polylepis.1